MTTTEETKMNTFFGGVLVGILSVGVFGSAILIGENHFSKKSAIKKGEPIKIGKKIYQCKVVVDWIEKQEDKP